MDGMMVGLLLVCTILVTGVGTFVGTRTYDRHHASGLLTQQVMDENARMQNRLGLVEQQLASIGQAVLPISSAFQTMLVKELTHFHEERTDLLLAKLGPPMTLTTEEEEELLNRLKKREEDMGDLITPSERDAAHILPLIMRRARAETEALRGTPVEFRLVTVVSRGETPT